MDYANKAASRRHMVTEAIIETDNENGHSRTVKKADDIARDKLRAEISIKSVQLVIGQVVKLQGDKQNPIELNLGKPEGLTAIYAQLKKDAESVS